MDSEKLIEQLKYYGTTYAIGDNLGKEIDGSDELMLNAATALSTLQAENEKLRAELEQKSKLITQQAEELERRDTLLKEQEDELEQVKRLYESEKEDFLDYACSGIPNFAPYCFNRHPDCVDERGWCKSAECHGFSRNRGQKED